MISVPCPKCGAIRRTTPNTSFQCSSCKSRISVDSNGNIKTFHPSK